ncbi:MAG TPA: Holliday junction resolvase Hjc [Candidatus Nanoarchaeia archaeon]|nr:Holliday junction resolvase Hjc [Candidatus Nanoarchaeia archaeon]
MSNKEKGANAERELIHLFNNTEGWSAIRIAGSGSSKYPDPDILAGNAIRRIAIECKATREDKKYFSQEDLNQLRKFCQTFGAEAWLAIRLPRQPWYFIMPEDLAAAGESFVISEEILKRKGLQFEELTKYAGY